MRKFFLLLSLFTCQYLFSQVAYQQIILDQNGRPISNVLVQDPDGVCKTRTDTDGKFELNCYREVSSLQFILAGEL
ncbi:MAG TPA: hypothetical protein PLE23_08850, partial [Saprospiraceae bacterium]|nr:hypothetical protein [Saprospiraceae bacterium]